MSRCSKHYLTYHIQASITSRIEFYPAAIFSPMGKVKNPEILNFNRLISLNLAGYIIM